MRVIARSTLDGYISILAPRADRKVLQDRIRAWLLDVSASEWKSSAALKEQYASASIVSADRVVFNIKGNAYRLVTAIDYERGTIYIKWLGTHAEYDRIHVKTIDYSRSRYDHPTDPH